MFDIFDDEICYDRHPVATFLPNVLRTWREYAEAGLLTAGKYTRTDKEFEEEVEAEIERFREEAENLKVILGERDDEIVKLYDEIQALEDTLGIFNGETTAMDLVKENTDLANINSRLRAELYQAQAKIIELQRPRKRR